MAWVYYVDSHKCVNNDVIGWMRACKQRLVVINDGKCLWSIMICFHSERIVGYNDIALFFLFLTVCLFLHSTYKTFPHFYADGLVSCRFDFENGWDPTLAARKSTANILPIGIHMQWRWRRRQREEKNGKEPEYVWTNIASKWINKPFVMQTHSTTECSCAKRLPKGTCTECMTLNITHKTY